MSRSSSSAFSGFLPTDIAVSRNIAQHGDSDIAGQNNDGKLRAECCTQAGRGPHAIHGTRQVVIADHQIGPHARDLQTSARAAFPLAAAVTRYPSLLNNSSSESRTDASSSIRRMVPARRLPALPRSFDRSV